MKKDKTIQDFIKTHCATLDAGLSPKSAFKGGRTECFRSLYKCSEDEKIYFDVTSLYPLVMARKPLPVGMPKVYKDNFPDPTNVQGLIGCTVEPPTTLKIPMLPYNCHSRLMFGLCRTCMEEQNIGECQHDTEQREFRGTFCSPELQEALKRGYKISKIHEVWEFQMQKGLFQEYVGSFLTMKQEASGFPAECETEEAKREYIREYEEKEHIRMNYDNIKQSWFEVYIENISQFLIWEMGSMN